MLLLLHSLFRWLVVLAALGAVVGYVRARARDRFDGFAERAGSLYAAAIGVQVLIGVALWLVQGRWSGGDVFRSFIHPAAMVAAAGIASVGVARARRGRQALLGLGAVAVSLALVVAAIPTDAWPL